MSVRGVRSAVRWIAGGRTFEAFVKMLERLPAAPNRLRILTYHRVDTPQANPHLAPQPLSATPEVFRRQMEFLSTHYHAVSLDEVLKCHREGDRLPPRSVLITFDDAYIDFSQHALPVLESTGLPSTMFVPTAYPDHPTMRFWWDRLFSAVMHAEPTQYVPHVRCRVPVQPEERRQLHGRLCQLIAGMHWDAAERAIDEICSALSCRSLPKSVLGWDELRAIATRNVTLAPHTRTHPLLNRVSIERAREEVVGSWQDLEREIGSTPRVLAYPGGALTTEVAEMLRSEGFEMAMTTQRGINELHRKDPLRLRRVNVGIRCPLPLWRSQLVVNPTFPVMRSI